MGLRDIKVLIRTGKSDDAKYVLEIQRNVISENKYLISVPDEFNKTIEQQRNWIQKILGNDRGTIIVVEHNKKVIGWIVFQSQNLKRLSHTGYFVMMIQKEYRGLGIGKMLIEKLLIWAKNNPLIEKISLGVLSTNKRAISLYKSVGFKEEGRKIKEVKLSDTEYVDDVLMYKFV